MQTCCQSIASDHQSFNERIQIGHSFENQSLYEALAKTFSSWSSLFVNQGQAISSLLVDTARYTEKEIDSMEELIQLRKAVGIKYFKKWQSLEEKKNKLLDQGYSKNWEFSPEQYGLKIEDFRDNKILSKYLMLPKVRLIAFPHSAEKQ